MSGQRDDSLLLDDLITAATRLVEIGGEYEPGDLGQDRESQEMVQWNLLMMGEAVKRLRPVTRERFPDVNWSALARTRDRIVHHYEGVDWWLLEEIVTGDIPALLPRLIAIRDIIRSEFDATT